MKILIAAGGSGGHLLPAQQLGAELQKEAEVLFAGYKLDSSPFFQRPRFAFQAVSAAPLRLNPRGLLDFIKGAGAGAIESIRLIRSFQPDVVVGFGSFHSFPVLLAASVLRRRIILFEANCLLGKVNRLFARDAQVVAAQFELKNAPARTRFVPLLPWSNPKERMEKNEAREKWGLAPGRPTILVFGGSQGAAFLNRAAADAMPNHVQVIHLAGNETAAIETAARYRQKGIPALVKAFESNMHQAYAAADCALCRSGAGTIAELIRYGLPAVLIPFPQAMDNHQQINAEFLAKKIRGARMLIEIDASSSAIGNEMARTLQEQEELKLNLTRFAMECGGRESFRDIILGKP
jgi:UDP-N-acetylglucosamine--N-acetylmuramyl-(pentapeptide) pyrophosphoryl-undecaprenol N-acetylglucosamine transferase